MSCIALTLLPHMGCHQAPSIILRAAPNRGAYRTISASLCWKSFVLYTSLSACMFLSSYLFPRFSVPIVLTRAKFETPAKNGETASIFSCTVHWLMSGTGHYVSRYRKCALSCLSCQYLMVLTKCHSRLGTRGRSQICPVVFATCLTETALQPEMTLFRFSISCFCVGH